jgi:hypothetical protein
MLKINLTLFFIERFDRDPLFSFFDPALKDERRKIYLFPLGSRAKTGRFFESVKVEFDTLNLKHTMQFL